MVKEVLFQISICYNDTQLSRAHLVIIYDNYVLQNRTSVIQIPAEMAVPAQGSMKGKDLSVHAEKVSREKTAKVMRTWCTVKTCRLEPKI